MKVDLQDVWGLTKRLWRRKYWIIVPTLLGTAASFFAMKTVEPQYRATALLLVERQRIPTDFVEDTVTSSVDDRLRLITQQVKQDEILDQIIKEFNLYPTLLERGQINQASNRVRSSLRVTANNKTRTVKIQFTGPDRRVVAPVANRIAELVMNANLRIREDESRATSAFVDAELAEAKRGMEEKAEEIGRLRKTWAGRLPEDRVQHERTLRDLHERLREVEEKIENVDTRRFLVQQAEKPADIVSRNAFGQTSRLEELKRDLERLRAQYTDRHPDVIRLEREIAALGPETPPDEPERPGQQDPFLLAELQALDIEIDRLQTERQKLLADIQVYRGRLEGIPSVELELSNLEMQYNNLDGFYRSLLKKQIEARLAENLELRQQSEKFSILERATTPRQPFRPNLLSFLLIGTSLGGALGIGLAFLREETDQTFIDPHSLKEAFPAVPLLSVIPRIDEELTGHERGRGKRQRTA